MKKISFLLLMMLSVACARQSGIEEPSAIWNGYFHYLKSGESTHTLWAGKNINIGTVIYGIDDNANFYVTYDCGSSGWQISETHMYAGDRALMPLNKPGRPKIGLFPHSGVHQPRVTTYTYRVPLTDLPPCAAPGFIVAAHCVAHSPWGQTETAWAEGDFTFSDKGWGWYDTYYYDPPVTPFGIIYGTTLTVDSLILYHIDLSSGMASVILREFVGNTGGNYNGAAYDSECERLFFSNTLNRQLWYNDLASESPSVCAGLLDGIASNGTFRDGSYYYADLLTHTLRRVDISPSGAILCEAVLDTIPGNISIDDMAMSPDGSVLYMTGSMSGGGCELISWTTFSSQFFIHSLGIDAEVQIAFGSDGLLYAVAPYPLQGNSTAVYTIDLETDSLTELPGPGDIIIEDPFSDLTQGPVM
jgi:hypothetical protein